MNVNVTAVVLVKIRELNISLSHAEVELNVPGEPTTQKHMIEYRNEYCHAYSLRIGSLTELVQLKHNRYLILVIGFDHPCLCVHVCM